MNIKDGELLIPGAQGIGFMALGICLFSPYLFCIAILSLSPNKPC
jgi:hypothetical protein